MSETQSTASPSRGSLPILLAVVFVDLLGFSLILPLLPFYAETFGASATMVGFLVASYAVAQLFGAPILGGLSDRYGRRPVLFVSIVGTAIGFLLFGLAHSLWMLFASRILDGITGGNISVAQAYVSDVSTPKNRARNFGLIGAAFGLGFIIGPAMGGFLSRWSYTLPVFIGAGMATFNAIAVLFFLPESVPPERRSHARTRPWRKMSAGMRHLMSADRASGLLRIRFFYGLAFATFETIFPLYAQYHLSLTAEKTGYVLAYVGITIVIVQGGLVGRVSRRFSENGLILGMLALMAGGLLAWGFAPTVPILLVVLLPISFAGGVFGAVSRSALSHAVDSTDVGSVLGVGASLDSLTRALSPSLGGVLLGHVGTWAPGLFGAAVLVLVLPYAVAALRRPAKEDLVSTG